MATNMHNLLYLYVVYNPKTGMYLGIPRGEWKLGWVPALQARMYRVSLARMLRTKQEEKGLQILRWKVREELYEA